MSRLRKVDERYSYRIASFLGETLRYGRYLFGVLAMLSVGMLAVLGTLVGRQVATVPDLAFLQNYHPVDAIEIYDKNDHMICSINKEEMRKTVALSSISKDLQNAVLAAEDHHFYQHHGINFPSIFRAFFVNLQAGHVVEGGSTISQQLVKNLFFNDAGRTFVRKIAEAIVAEEVENRYTKKEILAMYLNEIYFGNGAHGIEQAAKIYFAETAAQITLPQAAFLAAVIKAPSVNGRVDHRAETLDRQREILDSMAEYGYITPAQMQKAKASPLDFQLAGDREIEHLFTKYPYYVSYVLSQIRNQFDDNQIRRTGLRVFTNLDPVAQASAEEILSREIKLAPKGVDEEALVSINLRDGAVIAIVGGAGDYWKNQWNCATNPHTVGSAFKPFVYLTAFLQGALDVDSQLVDEPLTVNQIDMTYTPKNYDGKYLGKISVRQALAKSRNTCAVRVAQKVGVSNIVTTAQSLGISSKMEPNLSIALGSCAASPLELAAAYGTLARGGVAIEPWTVRHIDDLNSHVKALYGPTPHRVLPEEPITRLVDIMQDVVTSGTGTLAKLPDRPVAGKTGTADQGRDLWFIGFTPDMVTAVWGGNRENKPISDKHATGGSVMARAWREYNLAFYKKTPTPAGQLIAAQSKEIPAARAASSERTAAPSSDDIDLSTLNRRAASGTALRARQGVTEYDWSR